MNTKDLMNKLTVMIDELRKCVRYESDGTVPVPASLVTDVIKLSEAALEYIDSDTELE